MKKLRYGVCLLLVIVMLLNLTQAGVPVHASDMDWIENEEEIVTEGDLKDAEFADDRVLVVLSNEASLAKMNYEASDFSEVGCSKVQNLTEATGAQVQAKLDNLVSAMGAKVSSEQMMELALADAELSSYQQVLCLQLENAGKENVVKAMLELEKREDVVCAGPDYVIHACSTMPNDPYVDEQWAIDKISLPQAWDISTGSSSLNVAVIDSGIDGDHPDLADRINTSLCRDFTSGSVVATGTPTDAYGHGTRVAGVIGAVGNNGTGVSGVCWNIKLVSLRVLGANGQGYSSYAAMAIDFARAQNIRIANFSIAWDDDEAISERHNECLKTVINNYTVLGLFVCGAGNTRKDIDLEENKAYPASYENVPKMVVVGASDTADGVWYGSYGAGSNYGENTVDLFAPGWNIKFTTADGGYGADSGTSYAAPYVAGVAALIRAKYPDMAMAAVRLAILRSVDVEEDGDLTYKCVTGGRLNAHQAMTLAGTYMEEE